MILFLFLFKIIFNTPEDKFTIEFDRENGKIEILDF
jgi:hypothetical protein